MNQINTIYPYKHRGQWVFDDEATDLNKEPFVAGADDMLDMLVNKNSCILIFSKESFPDATHQIRNVGSNPGGGTDYYSEELQHELWLCPALLKYFEEPPANIYFKVK